MNGHIALFVVEIDIGAMSDDLFHAVVGTEKNGRVQQGVALIVLDVDEARAQAQEICELDEATGAGGEMSSSATKVVLDIEGESSGVCQELKSRHIARFNDKMQSRRFGFIFSRFVDVSVARE